MDIIGQNHEEGRGKAKKKIKKLVSHFSGGAYMGEHIFFLFFDLAACPIPPFYYEINLQPQERGGHCWPEAEGGGARPKKKKKKKLASHFSGGGQIFF